MAEDRMESGEYEDVSAHALLMRVGTDDAFHRLARLQAMTASLSRALSPAEVGEVFVTQGVAAYGADAGAICLRAPDGEHLELIAAAGYPDELTDTYRWFSLDAQRPLAHVVRTGVPLWLESEATWDTLFPDWTESRMFPGTRSAAILPLVTGTTGVLGAIALSFRTPQRFTDEGRLFMEALTQLCAQALDRAGLFVSEQRARRRAEQLATERAALLEQMAGFLAAVAHDLKTPVAVIHGSAQLLRRRIAGADLPHIKRVEDEVGRISATAGKMSDMIDSLLDLSRLDAGLALDLMRRPTELVSLVREAAAAQSIQGRYVHVEAEPAEVTGDWDAARLERVFANLASNAVRYSPDGSEVTVSISREHNETGAWAIVRVMDAGIGIPEEDMPRIFDRFYRASNAAAHSAGAGIGLATVREIVEQHGGTIVVESVQDRGTVVTVRLPLEGQTPH